MRRRLAAAMSALCIAGLLAVAAAPASANAPQGKGLVSLGTFSCEGFGDVSVFAPRGAGAATAFTTTGQHVVVLSVDVSQNGQTVFSKTYGKKAGLTPVNCSQHAGTLDISAVVALVPPS
jgi:CubicO group peptidase (beta-lactamase class C family)